MLRVLNYYQKKPKKNHQKNQNRSAQIHPKLGEKTQQPTTLGIVISVYIQALIPTTSHLTVTFA